MYFFYRLFFLFNINAVPIPTSATTNNPIYSPILSNVFGLDSLLPTGLLLFDVVLLATFDAVLLLLLVVFELLVTAVTVAVAVFIVPPSKLAHLTS